MNSNYNSYGRNDGHFGGPSAGYRMNGPYNGGGLRQPLPFMGIRGGASSYGMRGGLPFRGSRGGRPFAGAPVFRRGEFDDREEVGMSPIQRVVTPRVYSRPSEAPRTSEFGRPASALRGRSRDFSRGKESAASSRPPRGDRSRKSREDRKPTQTPRQASSEPRAAPAAPSKEKRQQPRRDQETARKRMNQSQRSDRARSNPDTIWIRADDSSHFYVRLAKNKFYRDKEMQELTFHAAGKTSIYTAFKAVEVLSRYGYVTLGMIKTSKLKKREEEERDKAISKVEISLKRTSDFDSIYEEFQKVILARRPASEASPRGKRPPAKNKPQEEVKDTPKKVSEEIDSGSGEAPTSTKSQSTPEKQSSSETAPPVKDLKKDRWWLEGVSKKELTQLEVDDEPVVYM